MVKIKYSFQSRKRKRKKNYSDRNIKKIFFDNSSVEGEKKKVVSEQIEPNMDLAFT